MMSSPLLITWVLTILSEFSFPIFFANIDCLLFSVSAKSVISFGIDSIILYSFMEQSSYLEILFDSRLTDTSCDLASS